eukprot:SM010740S14103  [mRNA]  locus=s10740:1:346:- [translate_table: standard]
MSRDKMQRPWRVDDFDAFQARWFGHGASDKVGESVVVPHKRALLFVDNSGADI